MGEPADTGPPALKEPESQHPIAGVWRPMLREVLRRLVIGDYGLTGGIPGVEPVSMATAEQIRRYLADYGATLIELPQGHLADLCRALDGDTLRHPG